MSFFDLAVIFSVAVVLYNFQQIKMTLKDKGYPVETFKGWLRDYRQFKGVIQQESDLKTRTKYQKTLNGLHFSLLGLILFAVLAIRQRM